MFATFSGFPGASAARTPRTLSTSLCDLRRSVLYGSAHRWPDEISCSVGFELARGNDQFPVELRVLEQTPASERYSVMMFRLDYLLAPSWILKRIQELRSNGCFSPLDTSENVLPRRSFRKSSTVEANKSQYILSYVQKHDSQRETLSKYDFLTVWCIPTYKQTTMVPITCRYK